MASMLTMTQFLADQLVVLVLVALALLAGLIVDIVRVASHHVFSEYSVVATVVCFVVWSEAQRVAGDGIDTCLIHCIVTSLPSGFADS